MIQLFIHQRPDQTDAPIKTLNVGLCNVLGVR